jgi:hypothetical protein
MAKLDLQSPSLVTSSTPFPALVDVSGGTPGALVSVWLRQTRGLAPFFVSGPTMTTLDPGGNGSVTFPSVSLAGPTRAVLVATGADAAHAFYQADAETVEVL